MVAVAEPTTLSAPSIGRWGRSVAFLRRHRWFAAALGLGAVLRIITMLGFGPAMWFNDSYDYISVALHPRPHPIRPDGYGFWLLMLKPLHSLALVVFTQHLMGLGTGVLIYALLTRRFNLPGWGATLAAVPVLFDAYQIQIEQMIMSDAMFVLLVVGVITLVLWHREMSWKVGAAVGGLLALTALTRSIGLPILALVVVYLLVKRTGWKTILALVTACAIPVVGYMGWFKAVNGQFAMTSSDGVILYMRTASFSDCHEMGLDPRAELQLALLCIPKKPADRGPSAQAYLWWDNDNQIHVFGAGMKFDAEMNKNTSAFATRAILSQPGDYLAVVAKDFFRAFRWDRSPFPDTKTFLQYEFGNNITTRLPQWTSFRGQTHTDAETYENGPAATVNTRPWADIMIGYQKIMRLPGLALGVLLLIGLYGVALRWRKLGGPVLLPWLASVGLILAPAATAEFDYRYLIPAAPLACLAAAITLRHGLRRTRPTPPDLPEAA
ncbi:hypothetical protein GCM10009555_066050 [Acrocarpospora macrocephala]|uniref:Glycosyltransferase RgtA/B/C/D-like domain-containing protein n=1 Tax=Acrocarpospora macrocephala TaxID=150177 RepID=A0A5M3X1G4_9ACTN|nr:hypothetical protein [Acrocarpospora macrocephala]GES13411.1 hypothetical protein Amac_070080 [Acrocarpospora macrocephala]